MIPTLLMAAALAVAQAPADAARPPVPANPTASAADEGEKRTCRKERRTGSNMVTRVCRTATERREDADAARDALHNNRSIDNLDIGTR